MKFRCLTLLLVFCAACGRGGAAKSQKSDVCDLVMQVRAMPFRPGEKGFDRNYDQLFGDSVATDKLVECITDTRLMADPRMMPDKVNNFRVGDAAYMIFVDKSRLMFEYFFPEDVRKKVKRDGARYYFDWINQGNHREALKKAVLKRRRTGKAGTTSK
jgi:hypothetical protein